jgi:hypothetical protein
MTKSNRLKNHHRHHWHGYKTHISKLLSIIAEGEEKREGEGLPNSCRWKSSAWRGPGGGGGAGGGGEWSRWWFPSAMVKAGRTAGFPGTSTWSEAPVWRRSEALVWRCTRRTRRRSRCWQMCGGEMTWLGFRGSGTIKKKNSSNGHNDIINVHRYIWIINVHHYYGYARCYRFVKNRV